MININTGFNVSGSPIDDRFVLTKDQMKNMSDSRMPDVYMALCDEDNNLYTYNKSNTNDPDTGKYKLYAVLDKKPIIYGFQIDPTNAANPVTYLSDCDNADYTPVSMNLSTGEFSYGSWKENEFFMPRPCMLKYDGTVDYYLDPNDYTKKEDGSASDVDNLNYNGNAMMEWGRYNTVIWVKIEPDPSLSCKAKVYFTNTYEPGYDAWSFHGLNWNKDPKSYKPHFYTAIYNGCKDADGRLRSISGQTPETNSSTEPDYGVVDHYLNEAILNNKDADGYWGLETYVDRMLISLLLVLITKSAEIKNVLGAGHSSSPLLASGINNKHGLFYGTSSRSGNVKVFGMENYWGNMWRQVVGMIRLHQESALSGSDELRWRKHPPYSLSDMQNPEETEYTNSVYSTSSWDTMCIDFSNGIPLTMYSISRFAGAQNVYKTQFNLTNETTMLNPRSKIFLFGGSHSYGSTNVSPWFTMAESSIWLSPDYGGCISYR